MRILVTGFGPFGEFETNPSRVLAEGCGNHRILEVSYEAVTVWLDSLDSSTFDALLLMGLNGGASTMRLERFGHNRIGRVPDVRGFKPRVRRIDKKGPWRMRSTLWSGVLWKRSFECEDWVHSRSAGNYLCNFILYEALRRFPEKRVGFLHVPPFEKMNEEHQRAALARLMEEIHRLSAGGTKGPRCRQDEGGA